MQSTDVETVAAMHAPTIGGYAPVSLHAVRVMEPFEVDLFVGFGDGCAPMLFRSRECEFSLDESACQHQPSQWFYIRSQDKPLCDARLQRHLDSILEHDEIPPAERFSVLLDAVSVQLATAMQRIEVDATVREAGRVGRHITALVTRSTLLPGELLAIAQHNADTFAHILNTSAYAVLLARGLGVSDTAELERIAVGALLHDAGKRFLPKRLIGGAKRLTQEERRLIEEHPQKGYEELHDREDLTFEQLMMVYQHHERIDGKGYPVGLVGGEIHSLARLCSVVDIFEALTGKRSYRAAASTREALAELDSIAGVRLDEEMVQCWTALLSPQP